MKNIRIASLGLITILFVITACTQQEELADIEIIEAPLDSPWDSNEFDDFLSGNEFQVDNDGNGAHNWDAGDYSGDPVDNGIDIRDYIWEASGNIHLQCPSGNGSRRAEFREQKNRRLWNWNLMEFTCRFFNVPDEKMIFAQLHNDGGASRPYVTAFVENDRIYIERTNAPTGSNSWRHGSSLPFEPNHTYRVRISSGNRTVNVAATVTNINTGQSITRTWGRPSAWRQYDGQFYYKFGAYMPNGGSNSTRTRVQTLDISGY